MPSMTDILNSALSVATKQIVDNFDKPSAFFNLLNKYHARDTYEEFYKEIYEEYQEELNENLLKCG